ncbi:MAG: chromosome segregation protein SMC [Candidatus Poseidoniales archaeon]
MHLKALEMENFKSFKGEVTIPLDRGFTSITGPNGSGKSNCGDAIQFVLGPRSNKSLRANNAKDLLFNGGSRNKPAKHCTVTLILDNPADKEGRRKMSVDTAEIRMTRKIRLTKSGNIVSTYLLNDEESSQKSFRRLLAETNARADGYNIVLQGDVTSLAKMTGMARRKVLENVAGVTSYDEEIKKADRQKKQVEEYLERIQLLEEELSSRMKDLKKEREAALKYRDLQNELEVAKTTLLQSTYRSRDEEIGFIIAEQSRYSEDARQLKQTIADGEKELLSIDDRLAEVSRQMVEVLGEDSLEMMERINSMRISIDRNKDRISDAEESIEESLEDIDLLEDDAKEAEAAHKAHLSEIEGARKTSENADSSLKQAEEHEAGARKALLEGDRQTIELTRAQGKSIEKHQQMMEVVSEAKLAHQMEIQKVELADEQLSEAEENASDLKLAVDELLTEGEELAEGDADQDKTAMAGELTTLQREENKLSEEARAVENRLRDTERKLVVARTELESRSGSRDGMARAVQALLGRRDSGEQKGILGTISEMCSPKDPSHEDALATAIGGGMNSIIVENDQVAAECIGWLRQNRVGRATFLPLNKIQVGRASGRAMMLTRQPGIVGFAWEMLDHDPRIETAVRYVLRDTLIVQDLSTARKNMGGVRMVTLQGGVTEAGGAMVGGSKVRLKVSFGGRIQGMNEVDKLDAEVIRLQILADKVCDQLSACRRKQQELKQRIDNTSEDDRSMRKREWKEDFRLSEQRLAKATGAVVAVGQKLEDIEKKCSQKEQQLLRAEEAMRVSALVREVASAALQEVSPLHLQQTLREVQETRVKAFEDQAISKGIIDGGAAKGEILLERVGELNSRCSRLEQENAERLKNIKLWQGENESVVVELTDAEANHSQMAEEHKELEDERLRLTEERATMHAGLTQKANHAATLIKRAEEFTLQLVQKKDGLNDLLDEMTAVGCEVAGDNLALPSVADAEANARKLDHRLNKIGDVNMLAIEQYDITDARLNELKRDNKTLQQRRKSLIDLTERLEKQRKARLLHVLKCVDENFRKVYEILSDGGRGELFLENPEDPFKAGLSMWCQPSGKSSKCKLSLLSGGEQSMAALSLIFAIQDYDPSPFYYFDEVDQNLDAFNAERIAKMCRKRSKQAQFIMVTLRKVSLQLADHHIGITHAGDGCSRRIANFDKERAIELGAAALKELENEKSLAKVREGSIIDSNGLPNVDNMPTTPEGLPLPSSLGGLAERAEELTDDIEEHQEVRRQVIEETTTVEITEQQKDDLDLEGLLED